MSEAGALPSGLELVRTTPVFDQESVPAGLLRAHRVAEGVWGRIRVIAGALDFVFEDVDGERFHVVAGEALAIPPQRPHRIELGRAVEFVVEFHRPAAS